MDLEIVGLTFGSSMSKMDIVCFISQPDMNLWRVSQNY